ncbi:hypothetical protein AAD018_007385 [Aestuariibius insulae]|uniref:hypothetical protein n=1 Tax=Aestuariibius insulae TaxID=2058287 RepID=UPI00345E41BA
MHLRLVSTLALCSLPIATFAASDITSIEDVKRGQTVTVQGTVDRVMDTDEFRIRDSTGSLRVYVGPNWVPADVGEQVTVTGIMDDDLLPRPELYAREITVGDEPPITIEHRYE